MIDAIFEELEGCQLSAETATDTRRIALLLEARILLFREKERIQILEAPANRKPSAPLPPLEDVDLAVLRLQARLFAAELTERLPKQRNEAARISPDEHWDIKRLFGISRTSAQNLMKAIGEI